MAEPLGPPLWLLAELTYECPLQCSYCSNPLDMPTRSQELSTDQWLNVLSEARDMGAVQLGFSGGEPLLRKDLEILVKHASELGYYTNLITSGLGMTEKRIAQLKDNGLDHIQLSFQAARSDTNNIIGNSNYSFERKLDVAKLIKKYDYPMVLNFCITKQNIHQIDDILDLSCSLEGDFVELATVQHYGWAYLNRDAIMPSKQQLDWAEAKINDFRAKQQGKGPKFLFVTPDYYEERPKPCMSGWASKFLTIAPDGAALPCHSAKVLPLDFPNVKTSSVEKIWREDFAFNHFRGDAWMKEPCRSCDEKALDFGGCRCQAFMLTGDMYNADPVCSKSEHHGKIKQAVVDAEQSRKDAIYRHRDNVIPSIEI